MVDWRSGRIDTILEYSSVTLEFETSHAIAINVDKYLTRNH